MTGYWRGPVMSKFIDEAVRHGYIVHTPVKHNWLRINHLNETLLVDPTCVQFDSSEWSWDACVAAAAKYCALP